MKSLSIKQLLVAYMITVLWSCLSDEPTIIRGAVPFEFDGSGVTIIATSCDVNRFTVSILYGNDAALMSTQTIDSVHMEGELFTLVTWKQVRDQYGDMRRGPIETIETVTIKMSAEQKLVAAYAITCVGKNKERTQQNRIAYILRRPLIPSKVPA